MSIFASNYRLRFLQITLIITTVQSLLSGLTFIVSNSLSTEADALAGLVAIFAGFFGNIVEQKKYSVKRRAARKAAARSRRRIRGQREEWVKGQEGEKENIDNEAQGENSNDVQKENVNNASSTAAQDSNNDIASQNNQTDSNKTDSIQNNTSDSTAQNSNAPAIEPQSDLITDLSFEEETILRHKESLRSVLLLDFIGMVLNFTLLVCAVIFALVQAQKRGGNLEAGLGKDVVENGRVAGGSSGGSGSGSSSSSSSSGSYNTAGEGSEINLDGNGNGNGVGSGNPWDSGNSISGNSGKTSGTGSVGLRSTGSGSNKRTSFWDPLFIELEDSEAATQAWKMPSPPSQPNLAANTRENSNQPPLFIELASEVHKMHEKNTDGPTPDTNTNSPTGDNSSGSDSPNSNRDSNDALHDINLEVHDADFVECYSFVFLGYDIFTIFLFFCWRKELIKDAEMEDEGNEGDELIVGDEDELMDGVDDEDEQVPVQSQLVMNENTINSPAIPASDNTTALLAVKNQNQNSGDYNAIKGPIKSPIILSPNATILSPTATSPYNSPFDANPQKPNLNNTTTADTGHINTIIAYLFHIVADLIRSFVIMLMSADMASNGAGVGAAGGMTITDMLLQSDQDVAGAGGAGGGIASGSASGNVGSDSNSVDTAGGLFPSSSDGVTNSNVGGAAQSGTDTSALSSLSSSSSSSSIAKSQSARNLGSLQIGSYEEQLALEQKMTAHIDIRATYFVCAFVAMSTLWVGVETVEVFRELRRL